MLNSLIVVLCMCFMYMYVSSCILSHIQSAYIACLLVFNWDCILACSYPLLLSFVKCLLSHLSPFDVVKGGEIMLMYIQLT